MFRFQKDFYSKADLYNDIEKKFRMLSPKGFGDTISQNIPAYDPELESIDKGSHPVGMDVPEFDINAAPEAKYPEAAPQITPEESPQMDAIVDRSLFKKKYAEQLQKDSKMAIAERLGSAMADQDASPDFIEQNARDQAMRDAYGDANLNNAIAASAAGFGSIGGKMADNSVLNRYYDARNKKIEGDFARRAKARETEDDSLRENLKMYLNAKMIQDYGLPQGAVRASGISDTNVNQNDIWKNVEADGNIYRQNQRTGELQYVGKAPVKPSDSGAPGTWSPTDERDEQGNPVYRNNKTLEQRSVARPQGAFVPIPPKERENISSLAKFIDDVEQLDKIVTKKNAGELLNPKLPLGGPSGPLGEAWNRYINPNKDYEKFNTYYESLQGFNRRELTGLAASIPEMKRITQAFANKDMTYEQFKEAVAQVMALKASAREFLLREGQRSGYSRKSIEEALTPAKLDEIRKGSDLTGYKKPELTREQKIELAKKKMGEK